MKKSEQKTTDRIKSEKDIDSEFLPFLIPKQA